MSLSNPIPLGANSTTVLPAGVTGACLFLPTVAGTLTITRADGVVLLNAYPVTAGVWTPLDMSTGNTAPATVTLAGGAAGTILVN